VATAKTFEAKYLLGQKLGQGCFGRVYACQALQSTKSNALLVAVKVVGLQSTDDKKGDDDDSNVSIVNKRLVIIEREHLAWLQVGRHRHCVCLYETFVDSNHAYFVMERCQGPVSRLLKVRPLDTAERALAMFSHMLLGIAHVHNVGLVHRDVKPDNFLAGGAGGDIIKLCDFGLTALLPPGLSPADCKLGGTHGTPAFMSPEMLLSAGYNAKTDVWSFGAMCHLLLYGIWAYAPLARSAREMKVAIKQGAVPPQYNWQGNCKTCVMMPFDIARFVPSLKRTLQREPSLRPSAEEASEELHANHQESTPVESDSGSTISPDSLASKVSPQLTRDAKHEKFR